MMERQQKLQREMTLMLACWCVMGRADGLCCGLSQAESGRKVRVWREVIRGVLWLLVDKKVNLYDNVRRGWNGSASFPDF